MNSRSSVNESNLVNLSGDLSALNQLDTKDSLALNFPFDHIYACHSESSDRRQTSLDKEVEICTQTEDKDIGNSANPTLEVSRLSERLTASEAENKNLKNLLVFHLDLIQQQNDLITTKDKQNTALRLENDSLKSKVTRMDRRINVNQRHNINPAPHVHPPTPNVPSTAKSEPGVPETKTMYENLTEFLRPDSRTNPYNIFNSDVTKTKPLVPDSFDLNRTSETDYLPGDIGGVPSILDRSNLHCDKFGTMIENKRSVTKKEIKTEPRPEPRPEPLYTVTSNSGNTVIHKIQRNRRRTSGGLGSMCRLPKTTPIKVEPPENVNMFEDDKAFERTYSVNKKSKMINTYGKSKVATLPKKTPLYTGSLSDRLQLIDTTPTGEDPYQLGEADMREQSPIPKLMLQKTNHGRLKICSDLMGENAIPSRRIYEPPVTETSTKMPNRIRLEKRYHLPNIIPYTVPQTPSHTSTYTSTKAAMHTSTNASLHTSTNATLHTSIHKTSHGAMLSPIHTPTHISTRTTTHMAPHQATYTSPYATPHKAALAAPPKVPHKGPPKAPSKTPHKTTHKTAHKAPPKNPHKAPNRSPPKTPRSTLHKTPPTASYKTPPMARHKIPEIKTELNKSPPSLSPMLVQPPDLDLVKSEHEIDWPLYSPNQPGGNETSLCDFSYGESSNLTPLPTLDDVDFRQLLESETADADVVGGDFEKIDVLQFSTTENNSNDKIKRRGVRTTSLVVPGVIGEETCDNRRGMGSKRGRKRALSSAGIIKNAKQNFPKPVGPKPKMVKGRAANRGKKSPVPGMMSRKPYHTLVGDPDLSWYLGLDPDVKFEDIDQSGVCKASTVEVPRWREKPYTSCYSLEGTENLDDKVFEKRHQKLEAEERRQLRWHMRRIREQRHVERLRLRQRDPWYSGHNPYQPSVYTIWPQPQRDVRMIEITDTIPVMAFGEELPDLPPSTFILPWVRTSKALKRAKRSKTLH